jgi:hypothetical protein
VAFVNGEHRLAQKAGPDALQESPNAPWSSGHSDIKWLSSGRLPARNQGVAVGVFDPERQGDVVGGPHWQHADRHVGADERLRNFANGAVTSNGRDQVGS